MGRGNDQETLFGLRRNPFRQKILSQSEVPPGPLAQEKEEVTLLASPFSYASKRWGESLLTLHSFSSGQITPEEILLAQSEGFSTHLSADSLTLTWRRDGAMLGSREEDRNTYATPSCYRKRDLSGGGVVISKEWYRDGRRSRPVNLGPAIAPLVKQESQETQGGFRYEWWFAGRLLGFYTKEEGYRDRDGQRVEATNPPGEGTPWPGEDIFINALSHAQNGNEEKIIEYMFDAANNPFVIYPEDHISEEDLLRAIKHSQGLNKKEARLAIKNLINRGILKRKARGLPLVSRENYLTFTKKAAKPNKETSLFFENKDKISQEILENLREIWKDPSEEHLQRLIEKNRTRSLKVPPL